MVDARDLLKQLDTIRKGGPGSGPQGGGDGDKVHPALNAAYKQSYKDFAARANTQGQRALDAVTAAHEAGGSKEVAAHESKLAAAAHHDAAIAHSQIQHPATDRVAHHNQRAAAHEANAKEMSKK